MHSVVAQVQPSQAAAPSSSKTFHHGITYVSYEGNSFWLKFNNSGELLSSSNLVP